MDFLINPVRKNNQIAVTITGTGATADEKAQESKFGAVFINFGGSFSGPPPFVLGNSILPVKMDDKFIHVETFNATNDPKADDKAKLYIQEMTNRIITAKNQWDSQYDSVNSSEFSA